VTVKPNEKVGLPSLVFGPNAYVVIDAENGSTSGPANGQSSGGTYSADLMVTMIQVHGDNVPLLGRVDITVGQATAHSDFPQTTICTSAPTETVSGNAVIASETTNPSLLPVSSGFVSMPESGGNSSQSILSASVPPLLSTGVADSSSTGTITPTQTTSSSEAEAANVCVLTIGGSCTIGATAVKSESSSSANALGASSNDTGTQLVGLQVRACR
jgi:hypothetical protein